MATAKRKKAALDQKRDTMACVSNFAAVFI